MTDAASILSTATSATQDPPHILVFIPARDRVPQFPRVIAQVTPEPQHLFACAKAAA